NGDAFDVETLTLLAELTERAWQVPYSRRVSSLANYQHTWAQDDDLIVEELVGRSNLNRERLTLIRALATSEPDIVGSFASANGAALQIEIRLSLPADKLDANDEVMSWVLDWLNPIRGSRSDVEIFVGGTVAADVDLGLAVKRDVRELVIFSYLVILGGLVFLLRHGLGTAATLVIVTLSITGTMGIYGWFGQTLEAVSGFVPSIVMTIAVADSVHILSSYYHEIVQGKQKQHAVLGALRVNLMPVALTSVTTALGVMMLNFSDSPPYHDLGNMVAMGVGLAWFLSMTLLPALLLWFPEPKVQSASAFSDKIAAMGAWIIVNRRVLLLTVGGLSIAIASFIPRNELTEDWNGYFDESFEIRRASNALAEHFGGLHALRYVVDSGVEHGIDDPAYLAELRDFTAWLREQPEVSFVGSLTDLLARLNMNLHGDNRAERVVPKRRELAAQYLLLYEMSLPLGQGLEDTINVDRSATQLVALVSPNNSEALIAFDLRAQAWLDEHAPHILPSEATGVDMVFAHINHRNIRDLLKGVLLGIMGIALLLFIALRSLRLGLLSILTNLAPATLAYGTWGIFIGAIDMSASVVMCMSLGIVVDDTVHFMSKYRHARLYEGQAVDEALRYAFRTVGLALVVTTIVLVGGFAVLGASHFSPSVRTGTLMAITLSYALVIDFFVLPPLLMLLERRDDRQTATQQLRESA
ncbi:MAG: MMPL family transporter, partial [Pseudomonadota bacterium]